MKAGLLLAASWLILLACLPAFAVCFAARCVWEWGREGWARAGGVLE